MPGNTRPQRSRSPKEGRTYCNSRIERRFDVVSPQYANVVRIGILRSVSTGPNAYVLHCEGELLTPRGEVRGLVGQPHEAVSPHGWPVPQLLFVPTATLRKCKRRSIAVISADIGLYAGRNRLQRKEGPAIAHSPEDGPIERRSAEIQDNDALRTGFAGGLTLEIKHIRAGVPLVVRPRLAQDRRAWRSGGITGVAGGNRAGDDAGEHNRHDANGPSGPTPNSKRTMIAGHAATYAATYFKEFSRLVRWQATSSRCHITPV